MCSPRPATSRSAIRPGGDASRMARDVDQALHEIIATHGAMSPEAATEHVNGLKREKRYLRDVY